MPTALPEDVHVESHQNSMRSSRRVWILWAVAVVLLAALTFALSRGTSSPRKWIEKADLPAFHIDPAKSFQLEFGRGSGRYGLDSVKLDQSGHVVLRRRKYDHRGESWESATQQLSATGVAEVLDAVETNSLMAMHRAYHADVHDGTQWAFWVKQEDREKAIYFNNNFPDGITRFAAQLDSILSAAGLGEATWEPLPPNDYDRELWSRIRR